LLRIRVSGSRLALPDLDIQHPPAIKRLLRVLPEERGRQWDPELIDAALRVFAPPAAAQAAASGQSQLTTESSPLGA